MKILYFAPKEQLSFVRLLFRGHKFKGVYRIEDLIQYMCDPFLLCLFDSNYSKNIHEDKFLQFKKIFGQEKMGEVIYQRHDSQIEFNESLTNLKQFAAKFSLSEKDEKRTNLRIQPRLNLEIKILGQNKNKQAKCINISTDGICLLSSKITDRFVDIIIDNKYTAQGKICWQEEQLEVKDYYLYGISLKLDEPEKFRRYIKNDLLLLQLGILT